MKWSEMKVPDKIEAIKQVWKQGNTAQAIAVEAGAPSAAAVLGIYNRHREKLAGYPLSKLIAKTGGQRRLRVGAPPGAKGERAGAILKRVAAEKAEAAKGEDSLLTREYEPLPESRSVGLMEVARTDCHFILSMEPAVYCGAPAGEKTYCEHHRSIMYRRPEA